MAIESDTSTAIVRVARELLQSVGFRSLRFQQISEALGITRASIHYYFPSKTDLGVAVMAQYHADMSAKLVAIDRATADPRRKLELYVDLYHAILAEDLDHMCPGGMLAAEVMTLPPPLRAEAQAFFEMNEAWLRQVLGDGVAQGRLAVASVEAEAGHIVATLEGALLMSRLHGGSERLSSVAAQMWNRLWREAPASSVYADSTSAYQ